MMASLEGGGSISNRRDPCKKCGLPVFLAERLSVDNHLYHRTCFRCARCSHQLSLANYYETEDSEYCCETCPDEDDAFDQTDEKMATPEIDDYIQQNLLLTQSLSDEEKEHNLNKDKIQNYSYDKFTNARSNFVGSQLNVIKKEEDEEDIDKEPPDLPKTNPPDRNDIRHSPVNETESLVSSGVGSGEDMSIKDSIQNAPEQDDSGTSLSNKREQENRNSVRDSNDIVYIKNSTNNFNDSDSINQPLAADNHTLDAAVLDDKKANDSITEFVTKDDKKTVTISRNGTIFTPDSNFTVAAAANFRLINQQLQQQLHDQSTLFEKTHFDIGEDDSDLPVTVTAMNSELIKKNHEKNVLFDKEIVEEPEEEDQQQQSATTISNIDKSQKISNSKEQQLDNSDYTYIPLTIDHKGIKSDVNEKLTDNKNNETKTVDKEKLKKNQEDYPEELNPFEDEDDDDDYVYEDVYSTNTTSSTNLAKKESTNPFGSDDDEDDNNTDFKETVNEKVESFKKLTSTPKESTNPFGSDEDDEGNLSSEDNNAASKPVPKPRSILHFDSKRTPEPTPRKVGLNTSTGGIHGSISSLESLSRKSPFSSPSGTYRKKKPAPPPPTSRDVFGSKDTTAMAFKDMKNITSPPTVKLRKNRPAPAPPPQSTRPKSLIQSPTTSSLNDSSLSTFDEDIAHSSQKNHKINSSPTKSTNSEIEKEKNSKDEKNRNRQSMTLATTPHPIPHQSDSPADSSDISINLSPPNKSTYGKWKRKKGPAPPRPVPQRRQINILPADELRRQLDIIEIQQQGLEKQGVKLEQLIRLKSEMPGVNEDSSLTQEVEDLVLQLFELVNEKNELFRKQAELMYLRRQQRLEEEHADLEYQIRCLMERPESNKTDYDKAREEELINRLIEVVETRNEIIECLEMDRIREAEEDESISTHLNLYAAKRDEDLHSITSSSQESTKLSKKEKKKQKKIKKTKGVTIDADKDVDETEIVQKEKKKKKFISLFHV
ncbi:exonuclease 1-like isoform X2 [Chrysoperla carnea]|uniref:exonuclease 1-like isoform X2 n=1 Tax=Chrysoperla carnea TaxID=189513 RepID=UPI001D08AA5D|nr:exonuclease 1-like isoform X2 [Chrysoperla carnea]